MHKKFNNALIIGGTGMLENASSHLAKISSSLTIASRNPFALATKLKAISLELDWQNFDQAKASLNYVATCDLIISWVHEEGLKLIDPIEKLLKPGGRSIRIHTSKSADPQVRKKTDAGSRTDISRQTVILGWINQENGKRWLSHDEISQGVIKAIQNPQMNYSIVGTLSQG